MYIKTYHVYIYMYVYSISLPKRAAGPAKGAGPVKLFDFRVELKVFRDLSLDCLRIFRVSYSIFILLYLLYLL